MATPLTVAIIKRLRDETGARMMACKQALQDTGGDFEKAKRLLRDRGQLGGQRQ